MNEVERLKYVNGRRLHAGDLQLEQDYLVEMRRRLNRGLFTPGVVNGCDVRRAVDVDRAGKKTESKTTVEIESGLALDPHGREMVLTSARRLDVPLRPPSTRLQGYFLVMAYEEQSFTDEGPDCGPPIREVVRIRERPKLEWTEVLPSHAHCLNGTGEPLDCGIVLALVSLGPNCEIELVNTALRHLASPAHPGKAASYALEGEKDIDFDNAKVLHFEVRGGTPSAVTLYLWAEKFSSLHYTEMGTHQHVLAKNDFSLTEAKLPPHTHSLGDHTHLADGADPDYKLTSTPVNLSHYHRLLTEKAEFRQDFTGTSADRRWHPYVAVETRRLQWSEAEYRRGSLHEDDLNQHGNQSLVDRELTAPGARNYVENALTTVELKVRVALGGAVDRNPTTRYPFLTTGPVETAAADTVISHGLTGDVKVRPAGSPQHPAGSDSAYEYFTDLQVWLDDKDVTAPIVDQLSSFNGHLGDGHKEHEFVVNGTGALDLLDIARGVGLAIGAGPHKLKFCLKKPAPGARNGGKVLYNLFVE